MKGFCRNFVLILTFSFYEYFTEVLCAAFYKIFINYFENKKIIIIIIIIMIIIIILLIIIMIMIIIIIIIIIIIDPYS